jgi:hypothetical protein
MDNNTTYGYWRVIARHCNYTIEEGFERPAYIGEVKCPEDLSALTIGQLIEIGEAGGAEADYRIIDIVLGIGKEQADKCRATEVVAFLSWIGRQVKRINRLFEQVQTKPTAKEKQAGVDNLQFGLFGILDWYAKRMGITNHDEVLAVPWLRIYKCMEMDNKVEQYQRRYNEISMQEARRKKK